jgi:hypothetical protein
MVTHFPPIAKSYAVMRITRLCESYHTQARLLRTTITGNKASRVALL